MAATNPYDVDTSGIKVTYIGFDNGFYCFALGVSEGKGLQGVMFEMSVSQWLFENATPKQWFMGNDFPYADHPDLSLHNPAHANTLVVFERFSDVVQFERAFPVDGLSPTMLV